jgi:hypothetical protein
LAVITLLAVLAARGKNEVFQRETATNVQEWS